MLKDKEEELSKATERLSDQEVDVDEAVTTTAPLYKQYVFLLSFIFSVYFFKHIITLLLCL